MFRPGVALKLCLVALWAFSGCAANDYLTRTSRVRSAYQAYDYDGALARLDSEFKEGKAISDGDRLLYLMDKGMLLHAAGRWGESVRLFAEAELLSEKLDTTSVSEEIGSVVVNDNLRVYRGEDFEKLMFSTLQALNYASLGDSEGALVEVRRVNEKLEVMITKEKKPYQRLAIARYIGGVMYESIGEKDSAAIDYLKAAELSPEMGRGAAEAVLRLAKETERDDQLADLRKRWPDIKIHPLKANEGQVVVIIEAGRVPQKSQNMRRPGKGGVDQQKAALVAVPTYALAKSPVPRVELVVEDQHAQGSTVTDLDKVARVHLEERIGRYLLRSIASLAVKGGAAAAVGALTKSEGLGALAFGLLTLTQQADLRSWLSLPAEFQVARVRLPAGKHVVTILSPTGPVTTEVDVKAGKIQVLVVRRY